MLEMVNSMKTSALKVSCNFFLVKKSEKIQGLKKKHILEHEINVTVSIYPKTFALHTHRICIGKHFS